MKLAAAVAVVALVSQGPERIEKLRVVATLPILADIAREVGRDAVLVRAIARGGEDPHYVVATPRLMAEVRAADVFVELGLSLELWAERLLDGAGKRELRRGARGHVFAARGIPVLGVPETLSRASGDIHPEGNPHVWMDPAVWPSIARNIRDALARVAPDRRARFDAGLARFEARVAKALYGDELVAMLGAETLERLAISGRLSEFLETKSFRGKKLAERAGGWLGRARPLRSRRIVFYHASWPYFARRFGLVVVDHVEKKPGIPPSAAHKQQLVAKLRGERVRAIGVLSYYDDSVPRALAKESGVRVVILPGQVGAMPGTGDAFALVDRVLALLLEASGVD